jgi:hypothetical protein
MPVGLAKNIFYLAANWDGEYAKRRRWLDLSARKLPAGAMLHRCIWTYLVMPCLPNTAINVFAMTIVIIFRFSHARSHRRF